MSFVKFGGLWKVLKVDVVWIDNKSKWVYGSHFESWCEEKIKSMCFRAI